MISNLGRAAAMAVLLLGAFTAEADSRRHHGERHWRDNGGHYVRDHRDWRGRDCDDDRRWRGHRHYRRGDRYAWRDHDGWRRHYRDDYDYRDSYRRDRVRYGRDSYADLDVVIRVPLW